MMNVYIPDGHWILHAHSLFLLWQYTRSMFNMRSDNKVMRLIFS
jgi:hypothetical protein